jgi:CheY-like chemotaxis protein
MGTGHAGSGCKPSGVPRRIGRMVVLVVDDEPLIAMGTAMALADAGFVAIEAGSADQAMDILTDRTVDVVLTDYRMPRRNGVELARAMRQEPRLSTIPVVLMSGYLEEAVRGNSGLFATVIEKPFRSKELIAALEAALPAGCRHRII